MRDITASKNTLIVAKADKRATMNYPSPFETWTFTSLCFFPVPCQYIEVQNNRYRSSKQQPRDDPVPFADPYMHALLHIGMCTWF